MTRQFFNKFRQISDRHNFISRLKSMQKLQLNSSDFRRLCILKGIYPREPKHNKRPKGYDGTEVYYHSKDILFLLNDTILEKYRAIKAHSKKVSRAQAYMNEAKVDMLKKMTPYYSLNHIVRERYPTFKDALEDVDDALTLISMFAVMPNVKGDYNINNEYTTKSFNIQNQFFAYMYSKKLLRKVFISIKGIYLNLMINGSSIMFIIPHKFSRKLPDTVDYELMQTFLEFYITLMNQVICRLYKIENYQYPPQIDRDTMDNAIKPSYLAYTVKSLSEELDQTEIPKLENSRNLLKGMVFYISRETPYEVLTLLVHSYGGSITYNSLDKSITHLITDRIVAAGDYPNVEVTQTQWVVDSCNFEVLLPTAQYAPGAKLPPHVSPFKSQLKEAEYLPERTKEILKLKGIQADEMADDAYVARYMELEDDEEEEVAANDFSQLRYEVMRAKDKERRYVMTGAKDEQKGLQRLTLNPAKKRRHITLFKEKRDKMKRLAKVKTRRMIMKNEESVKKEE